MNNTFVVAGLASLLAAIVGGGLKAFGIEVPLLKSLFRQIVLGVLGTVLLAFGLGAVSLPKRPSMPTPVVTAFSQSHSIGPGQGTSIHVRAMKDGTCVQGAIATIRDNSGGRFQPSNTTTVSGMLGDGCEFVTMWALAADSPLPDKDVYHDMEAEVTKDGVSIGKAPISVLVHP